MAQAADVDSIQHDGDFANPVANPELLTTNFHEGVFQMIRPASVLAVLALVVSSANFASAAEPAYTSISVEKMCCKGCAQKIAGQLYVVKGVKEVRVNLEKKIVYVFPQQSKVVSPRSMWEAVEKGEDKPLRLAGPSGTFTEKPRF